MYDMRSWHSMCAQSLFQDRVQLHMGALPPLLAPSTQARSARTKPSILAATD